MGDGPVEEPAVDHARFLCPFCDEVKVCPDPDFLQRDDIESCFGGAAAGRRRVNRVRVCDPVCDGCDALPSLVCEEPQTPVATPRRRSVGGRSIVARNDVPAVQSEHSQPRPLRVCHRLHVSMVRERESEKAAPLDRTLVLSSLASRAPGAEQQGAEEDESQHAQRGSRLGPTRDARHCIVRRRARSRRRLIPRRARPRRAPEYVLLRRQGRMERTQGLESACCRRPRPELGQRRTISTADQPPRRGRVRSGRAEHGQLNTERA